jgi:hypothetical protein
MEIKKCNVCGKEFLQNRFWQIRCGNKECLLKSRRIWLQENKDRVYKLQKIRKLIPENKEKIKKRQKKFYIEHKEYFKKHNKEYRINNREKRHIINKKYFNNVYYNNIEFRLKHILRGRFSMALSKDYKKTSVINLIGCNIQTLKIHLEKQFKPGMAWENWGTYGWHIDHIIPCSKFDLSKEEEQKKCFHYTNLQPLWAIDNIRKSNKIEGIKNAS